MSRLNKLFGKPKQFTIGGEILDIKPLSIQHLDLLLDLESDKTRPEALKKLISLTLKAAVPEATDDEISQVCFQHFKELTDAIMNVNGLDKESAKAVKE